ncbi:MAG: AgmX/PglI C-terminal domain-containing protein [Myxococcaceae bacterium]
MDLDSAAKWISNRPPPKNTSSQILGVLNGHNGDFAACVEEQAREQPGVHGVVVMTLVIRPNGTTDQVGVHGSKLRDSVMARCIAERIRTWSFTQHHVANPKPITFPVKF